MSENEKIISPQDAKASQGENASLNFGAEEREAEKELSPPAEMKKKIVILVCLLACVAALIVLVVSRVGTPTIDFLTLSGSIETPQTNISALEKIEALCGARTDAKDALVLYEKTDADGLKTQYVLNIESGGVVASFADTQQVKHTVQLHLAENASWYSVCSVATAQGTERFSLSFFDAEGTCFAEKTDLSSAAFDALAYDTVLDLVLLDREVFRADKNGAFKRAFTLETFASLPNFEEKAGNYYFIEEDGAFFVYDADASLTATYRIPAAAQNFQQFYLSDGALLMQYVTAEGEHSDDYTYTENGQKYKLHQTLVSARNGEKTVLEDIPIFILKIYSEDSIFRKLGLNANMDNLAIGYPVKDGVLEKNDYYIKSVLLSNRGRVTSSVGDIIPAMQGGLILGIAKNRWVAKNLVGEHYLLNEWGSIVGRFPSDYETAVEIAGKIFVYKQKIYDWDLNLLYDMEKNGVVSHTVVGGSVLMEKENAEFLLYDAKKKEAKPLVASGSGKEVSVLGGILIAVKENGSLRHDIYNENGTFLLEIEGDAVVAYRHIVDKAAVIELCVTKGEETEVYLATVEE